MFKLSSAFLKQLWLTMGASLAFLVIGLVRGYSSSAIPSIERFDPHLIQSSEQKSWVGAIPPLGAFLGSVVSGGLMARLGRRRTLLLAAPLWTAGWLLVALAPNLASLLAGRYLTGFCVGLVLASAQVYVSECCAAETRGRLGSLPTLCMSAGILISYVLGIWMYWRYMAFVSAGTCVLLILVLLPLPESPVWLASRGRDAQPALAWLHLPPPVTPAAHDNHKLAMETMTMAAERAGQIDAAAPPPPRLFTRSAMLSPAVYRPLCIGFALLVFQQVSGIDAVIFFTVEIFRSADSSLDANMATVVVGAVQLLSNALSTVLVDAAGRRPLLLVSAAVMALSMAAMGAAFYFQFEQQQWLGYLPVASLIVFMVGFSLGFGGLPFLLLGELFPARYRSQLSALAGSVNLLTMFAVIKSYHVFQELLTSAGTFWLYSGCCCLGFVFVVLCVPETKGKTLAEIENIFSSKKQPEEELKAEPAKAVNVQTESIRL